MHVYIFGASGSGTTTLGKAISAELNIPLFEIDDYYWEKTGPPFSRVRSRQQRIELLSSALKTHKSWVMSGSMMGWGDYLIPEIDLAIYLYLPYELRMKRLLSREKARYGNRIDEGNDMYLQHKEFIEWASKYDTAGLEMRSKKSHEEWIKLFKCKAIKIEGDIEIQEILKNILFEINGK